MLINSPFKASLIFIAILILNVSNAFALDVLNALTKEEHFTISPFASMVTDPECKTPIEKFDVADNTITITKIAASMLLKGGDYKVAIQAAKTMNWLPLGLEIQLGDQLHKTRSSSIKFINPKTKNKRYATLYKKSNRVLNDVLEVLPEKLPFEVKLFITTERGVNASAQPGGYLYLTKEAAEKDADFLAVLIAHEVFHITKRHTTSQYQSTLIDSIETFQRFKSLLDSGGGQDLAGLAMRTAKIMLSYSNGQEAQADVCAGRSIVRMQGYHPEKGVNKFLKVSAKANDSSITWMSQHPSYEQRAQLFQFAMGKTNTEPSWKRSDTSIKHAKTRTNQNLPSTNSDVTAFASARSESKKYNESTMKSFNSLAEAAIALKSELEKRSY